MIVDDDYAGDEYLVEAIYDVVVVDAADVVVDH